MRIFFLLLITCMIGAGCKSPEKLKRTELSGKAPAELLLSQKAGNPQFEWLSAKLNSQVETTEKSISFKINLRLRKDSIIWLSMSGFGIEAVRAIITTDSVFVLNRVNNTLLETDFTYLSTMANTDIDFGTLQALITGSALNDFKADEFNFFYDKDGYLLSRLKKRKIRRVRNIFERIEKLEKKDNPEKVEKLEEKKIERIDRIGSESDSSDFIAQSLWLRPNDYRIIRYVFRDFNPDRLMEVNYSDFREVSGQTFPFQLLIDATGTEPVKMEMNYSRISINEPVSFPFSIPESYKKLKLE